jgi:hypothetical protein
MSRQGIMVLATTTVVIGVGSLYLLRAHGPANGYTQPDSTARSTSHVEVERSPEEPLPRAIAAKGGAQPPVSISGSRPAGPPDSSWFREITADSSVRVRQRYGELFKDMDLSAQQIEALVPVLIALDEQEAQPRPRDEPDGAIVERERAAITGVLGQDVGAQFVRLKQTLPARGQLNFVHAQLEETDAPLREDQRKQLLDIVRTQKPYPRWRRIEGESSDQQFARSSRWQHERAKRFIEEASAVLTPNQKSHLEAQAARNAAARPVSRAELGAARAELGAAGGSGRR